MCIFKPVVVYDARLGNKVPAWEIITKSCNVYYHYREIIENYVPLGARKHKNKYVVYPSVPIANNPVHYYGFYDDNVHIKPDLSWYIDAKTFYQTEHDISRYLLDINSEECKFSYEKEYSQDEEHANFYNDLLVAHMSFMSI